MIFLASQKLRAHHDSWPKVLPNDFEAWLIAGTMRFQQKSFKESWYLEVRD